MRSHIDAPTLAKIRSSIYWAVTRIGQITWHTLCGVEAAGDQKQLWKKRVEKIRRIGPLDKESGQKTAANIEGGSGIAICFLWIPQSRAGQSGSV